MPACLFDDAEYVAFQEVLLPLFVFLKPDNMVLHEA